MQKMSVFDNKIEPVESVKLTGIREKLFLDRYAMRNEIGEVVETSIDQSWRRMAKALASVEKTEKEKELWEKKFMEAMEGFKWVPAGRFFSAAGAGLATTMVNCFVVPSPEDSRKGIIRSLGEVTEISAKGGGVGFNVSSLRPRGSYISTVNGTSSGAVSWAELYSVAAHDIIQQGGTRRGALMIMMWDWHPDIEEFVTVKQNKQRMLGANLSVCISDKFMEAVKTDSDWELCFPDTTFEKYKKEWTGDLTEWLAKGYPVKVAKTISACYLWNLICRAAWSSAEPGVVFMDTYNQMNNSYYFEKVISVNPCGEQGLPAWGVCNLGSVNLETFVKPNVSGTGSFDFEELREVIKVAVRFMDNAIDLEKYPYEEMRKLQQKERRVGIGTMGLADALIKMKIRYGSDESLEIIEKIYSLIRDCAYQTSIDLGKERGEFPEFVADKFLESGFMKTMPQYIRERIRKEGIRNCFLLTQAPTGKISLLAGASSGIEPVFSFSYTQTDRLGERTMYHRLYEEWVGENGSENIPDYFVVANDLTPEEHVKIQALIQKYTDSSISKTVNAPEFHTVEDVVKLYELAYETGCKGIAYMREGSRDGTLVRTDKKGETVDDNEEKEEKKKVVWERPVKVSGATYKLKTPVGTAFITVNRNGEGMPFELFINVGRAGSDIQAMAEAMGRLISKALRFDSSLTKTDRVLVMIDQLKGIGGARPVGYGANRVMSLPDAVAKVLAMDIESGEKKGEDGQVAEAADICPDCGNASLVYEEGCKKCHWCAYSEC